MAGGQAGMGQGLPGAQAGVAGGGGINPAMMSQLSGMFPHMQVHPTPYTLHPTPDTLHPTPCTLHPAPYTLHPSPYTLHPTLHPEP